MNYEINFDLKSILIATLTQLFVIKVCSVWYIK